MGSLFGGGPPGGGEIDAPSGGFGDDLDDDDDDDDVEFGDDDDDDEVIEMDDEEILEPDNELPPIFQDARGLLTRSRKLLTNVHDEDKEEMINLHEQIEESITQQDSESLTEATEKLKEILFFIEGK